jgi:hypothetical protein
MHPASLQSAGCTRYYEFKHIVLHRARITRQDELVQHYGNMRDVMTILHKCCVLEYQHQPVADASDSAVRIADTLLLTLSLHTQHNTAAAAGNHGHSDSSADAQLSVPVQQQEPAVLLAAVSLTSYHSFLLSSGYILQQS